jgi:hypothetical protein
MAGRLIRIALAAFFVFYGALEAQAQQRPLITEDVEIVKPGVIRIESGFEFLQNQTFPLSGLKGDLVKVGDTRLSVGLSPNVEFQIQWTLQNFLSIDSRGMSAIPLRLGANNADTNDVGDVTLWMKMKLRNETRLAPALGFRFGVELPNTNETRGIGMNTTNFFATILAGKTLSDRVSLFGNIGLGILQAPLANFSQNDVLLYGLAGIYKLNTAVSLVGEVNGFHSTRKRTPVGTEDYSTARLGAQIRAFGVRWYTAGVFGLSKRAPKTGLSVGITYDWEAFTPIK